MFFPNKTCQRGVIQQDAKDKGVEGDTDTEVICITEFRDQMKTLIFLKGKKARTRFTNIVYCFTEKYQENMSDSVYDQSAMLKKKILHDLG